MSIKRKSVFDNSKCASCDFFNKCPFHLNPTAVEAVLCLGMLEADEALKRLASEREALRAEKEQLQKTFSVSDLQFTTTPNVKLISLINSLN